MKIPSRHCTRCKACWTLYRSTREQLPASLQATAFPELYYNYCAGCGYSEVAKMPQRIKR